MKLLAVTALYLALLVPGVDAAGTAALLLMQRAVVGVVNIISVCVLIVCVSIRS